MPVKPGRSQLTRLMQVILALQAKRYPSAAELAVTCEVSRRTIYRDLETLKAAGMPVRYSPERQGYQLPSHFLFHAPPIEEKEAAALAVLATAEGHDDGLGWRRHARSGAWKLINSLTGEIRERVSALSELIQVRHGVFECTAARRTVYETILQSLLQRRQLRLWYLDPKSSVLTSTKLSPYRLLIDASKWSLIGRSTLHREVRLFRLPWVRNVELTSDSYEIPPRFSLERFLDRISPDEWGGVRVEIRLRFSARVAPEVQETVWHRSQRLESLPDGRIELSFNTFGFEEILGWILSFGDQVEVLAPGELRDRVGELALQVAAAHAPVDPPQAATPAKEPLDMPGEGGGGLAASPHLALN